MLLNKIGTWLINRIGSKYGRYAVLVWTNRWNNLFKGEKPGQKYLFVLSPAFCGSTLLNEILSTSESVSVNNQWGAREGQKLPTVRAIMYDHERRWDKSLDFDWKYIKKEWRKYWDLSAPILLEKSPPNIVRAKSIEEHFHPSYFIVFHRNPYAHCESLIRRRKRDATVAAELAIQCLNFQKANLKGLERTIRISYEELTDNTVETVEALNKFLPELKGIKHEQTFTAHNYLGKNMKVNNLNDDKISKLTSHQIKEINHVFKKNKEVLDFFNYSLIE